MIILKLIFISVVTITLISLSLLIFECGTEMNCTCDDEQNIIINCICPVNCSRYIWIHSLNTHYCYLIVSVVTMTLISVWAQLTRCRTEMNSDDNQNIIMNCKYCELLYKYLDLHS